MATIMRGWATAIEDDPHAGAATIESGIADFKSTGARMMLHFFLGLLAEAEARDGRRHDALGTIADALEEVDPNGGFDEAELHRLRGELLADKAERSADAEALIRQAVAVAHAQGAKALEARATARLAQLVAQKRSVGTTPR